MPTILKRCNFLPKQMRFQSLRARLKLDVSYKKIVICERSETSPFSLWKESHIRQGFIWRAASAGFATLEDGAHEISVWVASATVLRDDALMAIRVPFQVPASGEIEVASISDSAFLRLPPGTYELLYQYSNENSHSGRIRLEFAPNARTRFEVLRLPEPVSSPLDLSAEAAG